ncbi:MAG: hypothetical protein ACNA7I_01515 [Candidatus Methanoperedens sp.]|nr:hypothetical protein [Candidatus Methanoperedens sp.]
MPEINGGYAEAIKSIRKKYITGIKTGEEYGYNKRVYFKIN